MRVGAREEENERETCCSSNIVCEKHTMIQHRIHAKVSVQPSAKLRVIALVVQEEMRDRNLTPNESESKRAEGRAGGRTGGLSGGWVVEHSVGRRSGGRPLERSGGRLGRAVGHSGGRSHLEAPAS